MPGKSDYLEQMFLDLVFTATTDPAFASNAGTATNLYVSLHTANPYATDESADQTTGETSYTGYTRVAVARSPAGWTRTGSVISPADNIDFPQCSGGSATITHFCIGTSASGAGSILYSGAVTPNIAVSTGVIPRITTASTITED
jgi:hypothetical protein